jgi:serine/threonine protein kinase
MNPETLNGTVLGTCTLQRLIGRGGMGAVFLARQERFERDVALKMLLPPTRLTPEQRALFLQRFRSEMAVVASLEHSNILPVLEFGDRNGVGYLVMPLASAGTLQDILTKEGQLAWPRLMHYLDQMAAAIDYAQERGVQHHNIRPANVLLTPEGDLCVTDFGLVNIVTEGLTAQDRLLGTAGPLVVPDYMAPEQVTNDTVDGRTDLYSLAVLLYQMVTGKTPFSGTTAVYIAAQQVQLPPPSPRSLRTDLPLAAEQVILRAMAKQAINRYAHAQDFAAAFRLALTSAGIALPAMQSSGTAKSNTTPLNFTQRARDTQGSTPSGQPSTGAVPVWSTRLHSNQKTGLLRAGNGVGTMPDTAGISSAMDALKTTRVLPDIQQATDGTTGTQLPVTTTSHLFPPLGTTGALQITGEQSATGATTTIKLTDPVKIVQVPVAGQPGKYMTGFLPVLSAAELDAHAAETKPLENSLTTLKSDPKQRLKIVGIAALVAMVILSSVVALLIHAHSSSSVPGSASAPHTKTTPNLLGTAEAQATATVDANNILVDSLSQNIHNWTIALTGTKLYFFANGAYHIADNDGKQSAPSILPGENFSGPMAYTLTMQEIKGNDASLSNTFGMILRFTTYKKGNRTFNEFYIFEVVNMKGGQYQFWKYDSGKAGLWTSIWKHPFGSEFHWGHGPASINTVRIFASGKSFSFTVNGKAVGKAQDSSIASGAIGMLVNLKGTEVAFTNLELTRS